METFDANSFILGIITGCALASIAFAIRVKISANRKGNTGKSKQENITAGGDVVGRDKRVN